MINTYKSPKLTLAEDEVFTFGANSEGFHGFGAAGYASFGETSNVWRQHHYHEWVKGAKGKWNEKGKLGPQVGTEGKSYAIPTVTRAGAKRSVPLAEIKKSIDKFYTFAKSRPHLKFFVAQGVEGNLNGYSAEEMAPIYSGEIPDNVYFDEGFAALLTESGDENSFITKDKFIGEIIHCKRGKFDEYIGRPPLGQHCDWRFGNPFEIGVHGERADVISKYQSWLMVGHSFECKNATTERRQWILDHVHELRDQTLGCWCDYPKEDCHGRILKEMANETIMMGEIPEKCKCIIAGSRSITDYSLILAAVKESGFQIDEVVCGEAKGADSLGRRLAEENNIPVKSFPADWSNLSHPDAVIKTNSRGQKYDALAGHRRNARMRDYSTHLILIWDGKSSGSANMLKLAKERDLTIFQKLVN